MPSGYPASNQRKFKTKLEREKALVVVEEMHLRGCKLHEIAKAIGTSTVTAFKMKNLLVKRYVERQEASRERGVALAVARLEEVIRVAWELHAADGKDEELIREELGPLDETRETTVKLNGKKIKAKVRVSRDAKTVATSMKLLRRIVERRGRATRDCWLQLVRACLMDIARLRGWLTEVNINIGAQVAPGWEVQPDDEAGIIDVEPKALENKR